MSMELSRLLAMLLVTTTREVVLLVCIGVRGCLCPIISNAWRDGIASQQLMNMAPSSASAEGDMTALTIWEIVMTAQCFDGMDASSDMKNVHLL